MAKNTTIKKLPIKKILLIITGVIILIIAVYFISLPIRDKLDQNRFEKLDAQMQLVFKDIKAAANNSDQWNYKTSCTPNMTGWARTGGYTCTALITMEKPVTTVQEINSLQARYYPVIDSFSGFTQKTELNPQLPDDFGKKFVVSSAEKHYIEKKSGVECIYIISLNQSSEDKNKSYSENFLSGSTINTDNGNISTTLRCREDSRGSWY